MLRWRLLGAAAILTPLIALLVLDARWNHGIPGLWLVPLGWLLTLMAASEMLGLFRAAKHEPVAWTVYLGVSVVFWSGCAPAIEALIAKFGGSPVCVDLSWTVMAVAFAVMLVFVGEMRRYATPGRATVNVALALLAIVYAGLLMCFVAQLRFMGADSSWGMAALISLPLVVKLSDTGAYTVGKLFGRHKMSPVLSPGKTVEGAIGGFIFAAVASWGCFTFLVPWIVGESGEPTNWWGCWVYGLAVALAGMIGDLAVSLLKRDMRCKDSSSWLPGLGGVLDVVDSVLMAAPVAVLCWWLGIVGPGG